MKLLLGDKLVVVDRASVVEDAGVAARPGTILQVNGNSVTVACSRGAVEIEGLMAFDGASLSPTSAGLTPGMVLPQLNSELLALLTKAGGEAARSEQFWSGQLEDLADLELPYPRSIGSKSDPVRIPLAASAYEELSQTQLIGAFLAWLAAITAQPRISVSYRSASAPGGNTGGLAGEVARWFSDTAILTIDLDGAATGADIERQVAAKLETIQQNPLRAKDLHLRRPVGRGRMAEARQLHVGVEISNAAAGDVDRPHDLVLMVDPDGKRSELHVSGSLSAACRTGDR